MLPHSLFSLQIKCEMFHYASQKDRSSLVIGSSLLWSGLCVLQCKLCSVWEETSCEQGKEVGTVTVIEGSLRWGRIWKIEFSSSWWIFCFSHPSCHCELRKHKFIGCRSMCGSWFCWWALSFTVVLVKRARFSSFTCLAWLKTLGLLKLCGQRILDASDGIWPHGC